MADEREAGAREADVRETVALSSRVLAAHGQGDLIWGHSSSRDADGRGAWLKVAGWGQEEITTERVRLVSWAGDVLEGTGPRHSEYPIHTEIYAARPDVGGVVHTHSPYAVALAASGQPLRPVGHMAATFVPPDVARFTATSDLILTPELGADLAAVLGAATAVFVVNHGMVTVGATLQAATVAAVLLERACHQQLLTAGFGGWPTWMGADEALRKRHHFDSEQTISTLWNYLVRTVPPIPSGARPKREDAS